VDFFGGGVALWCSGHLVCVGVLGWIKVFLIVFFACCGILFDLLSGMGVFGLIGGVWDVC